MGRPAAHGIIYMMGKFIHKERLDWKGTTHTLELYASDSCQGLEPVAIPFVDNKHIVIYRHIDGYYGLPGGSIEEGENFSDTLKREIKEEAACEVLDYGLIGYIKDIQTSPPGKTRYQLRYWAKVKLLDEPVHDPDGKALAREIVGLDEAAEKLGWGERGQLLIRLAENNFIKTATNKSDKK